MANEKVKFKYNKELRFNNYISSLSAIPKAALITKKGRSPGAGRDRSRDHRQGHGRHSGQNVTMNHKSEVPLENAIEDPLGNATEDPR